MLQNSSIIFDKATVIQKQSPFTGITMLLGIFLLLMYTLLVIIVQHMLVNITKSQGFPYLPKRNITIPKSFSCIIHIR